jgi:hypothetical protein
MSNYVIFSRPSEQFVEDQKLKPLAYTCSDINSLCPSLKVQTHEEKQIKNVFKVGSVISLQ